MSRFCFFFFFNDTATTEIYTLSLHDALPIFGPARARLRLGRVRRPLHHGLRERPEPRAVPAGGDGARRPRDRRCGHPERLRQPDVAVAAAAANPRRWPLPPLPARRGHAAGGPVTARRDTGPTEPRARRDHAGPRSEERRVGEE